MAAYERGAYSEAADLWRPLAEKGDADAQYNLGHLYRQGLGVPKVKNPSQPVFTLDHNIQDLGEANQAAGAAYLAENAAKEGVTITESGLRTGTEAYELDVLIYATGFDAMTGALLKANLRGRQGRRLSDKWEHGPVTYLGLALSDFPNLFMVTGPGSPSVLCNMLVAIEQHVNWVGDCISHVREHGYDAIEAQAAAEDEWVTHVNEVAEGTMYTTPSCNSWCPAGRATMPAARSTGVLTWKCSRRI